ncbi:FtsX-like permease family protein [Peribacillus tepidiphilus]|uniref:FtsX-like permease family protein n=1 Tax=Peribacillus tepidiphilus TaxID=2652445 RepID=UPI0035B51F07
MVEENTSAISLMKVIGYQDSMISQLMINVYTPVVILSYFIGIPLAIFSLGTLLTSMAEQTNFIFPISVNPLWMVLGLVIILLTYYASLFISKYKIKKISLHEVLKHQEV